MPNPMAKSESNGAHPSPKRRDVGVLITIALALMICWSVIFSGNLAGRGAADDLNFHWLAIIQFAQQWPIPDLGDYASATTPGYHLILAPLVKSGMGHTGVQLVASIWTMALLGLLSWHCSATLGRATAILMLPIIASMYVLFPGIWLLPDNAGWLFVLGIVLLALRGHGGWVSWAIGGVLLFGLVWLRQIHIWAAAPIWLAAWLGSQDQTPVNLRSLFTSDTYRRIGRTMIAIGCTIPGFVALAWFLGIWGGLVPPSFQNMHQGPNFATPGFLLAQVAVLSFPFIPMLLLRSRDVWAHHWRWVLFALLIGLVLSVLPYSSYSYEQGRYGGWWNMVGKFPTIADRSPVYIVLGLLGSLCLVLWLSLASTRDIWVWVGVLIAFTLAQSANHASWQRYHEPMLLMVMVLIIARSPLLSRIRSRAMGGSIALAMILGSITVLSMIGAQPVRSSDAGSTPELNSPESP